MGGPAPAALPAWAEEVRPDAPALIALDGKTSRRSHDRRAGRQALHLVSAFATNERLVLGQEAVADKSCEQEAIPALLARLAASGALSGAVVTIDAIACTPAIAAEIVGHGADCVLAVKANQPSLHREIQAFFADAAPAAVEVFVDLDKDHGRIEERRYVVSKEVDWLEGALGPRRTVCIIDDANRASVRVAEKLGFREFARSIYKGSPIVMFERNAGAS